MPTLHIELHHVSLLFKLTIQEKLALGAVTSLNLQVKDGKIILTPIYEEANLSYEGSVLVMNSEKTDNLDIIHALREERIQEQMNWRVF